MTRAVRDAGNQTFDWARRHVAVAVLCVVFACLRVVSTLSGAVWTDPDSASYFQLTFWRPLRLWTVPLVYSIGLAHDHLVLLQGLLGVVAWVSAAVLISRIFLTRAAECTAATGVLVIGLTGPVTNFDVALLSESIAISLTVLLIALGLNLVVRPSNRLLWATSIVAFLWAFARQGNIYLLAVLAIVVACVALRRPRRLELVVLSGVFAVLSVLGIVVSNSNTNVQQWNVAEIIIRRVAPDRELLSWWRREGMPRLPRWPTLPASDTTSPPDSAIFERLHVLLENERFAAWLDDEGTSTYLRFLATHPRYDLVTPFEDRAVLDGVLHGVEYASVTQVVPTFVEELVWPASRTDALLPVALLGVALAVVLVRSRRRNSAVAPSPMTRRALQYAAVVLAISALATIFSAHAAGAEFGRVLLESSVTARLAIVIGAAALVERWRVRHLQSATPTDQGLPLVMHTVDLPAQSD
jgi:hypothetical protein